MSQLTNSQKETIIQDFKEWTGGYVPSEVTEKRVAKYVRLASALPVEFDDAVQEFLSALQTDGFIGENEFLEPHNQDNLLRLFEQAAHVQQANAKKEQLKQSITKILDMFLTDEIKHAGILDENEDLVEKPTVAQFDEWVARPDVLAEDSNAPTHILRDLLVLAESIGYTL